MICWMFSLTIWWFEVLNLPYAALQIACSEVSALIESSKQVPEYLGSSGRARKALKALQRGGPREKAHSQKNKPVPS